jgi:hypothetical protein
MRNLTLRLRGPGRRSRRWCSLSDLAAVHLSDANTRSGNYDRCCRRDCGGGNCCRARGRLQKTAGDRPEQGCGTHDRAEHVSPARRAARSGLDFFRQVGPPSNLILIWGDGRALNSVEEWCCACQSCVCFVVLIVFVLNTRCDNVAIVGCMRPRATMG